MDYPIKYMVPSTINIKFIAEKAGVSAQTVSNVINNKTSHTGEKTRKNILKLIEKYHYKPSRMAKSLRRGSSKTIGLVVPDIVNYPVYSEVFDLMEEWINEHGYNLLLYNTRENIGRENYAISKLIDNEVDGAIIIRIRENNPNLIELPGKVKFPIVGALRKFASPLVVSVLTDNKELGFLATQYLIKKGHKNIIHIAGDTGLASDRKRRDGYLEALKRNNIKINMENLIYLDYQDRDLFEKLKAVLEIRKDFTAIFAYTDIVAINCIKLLIELGYRLPKDVSIVGVDNFNIGNYISPALTSFKQPVEKICLRAMKLLINFINNKDRTIQKEKNIFFSPEIVEKESVCDIS